MPDCDSFSLGFEWFLKTCCPDTLDAFGTADCSAEEAELKSDVDRLKDLVKGKSEGETWTHHLPAGCDWNTAIAVAKSHLFTTKGLAGRLSRQIGVVRELEAAFQASLKKYNKREHFEPTTQEVTNALASAHTTHVEAMAIRVLKDASLATEDLIL